MITNLLDHYPFLTSDNSFMRRRRLRVVDVASGPDFLFLITGERRFGRALYCRRVLRYRMDNKILVGETHATHSAVPETTGLVRWPWYPDVIAVLAGMNLEFTDRDVLVKACFGARSIFAVESQVEALRAQVDETGNLVTSLRRFATRTTVAGELPVVFLMYRSSALYGVALLCFRGKRGIPTGVVSAGDGTGQGGVIARPADQIAVLETASRVLVRMPLIHTVLFSTLWSGVAGPLHTETGAQTGGPWQLRDVGFRLDLSRGRESTMERLGYKMRRNLGYYRRRAEARFGCEFVTDLTPGQRLQAVESLCDKGTYQLGIQKSRTLDAALLALPRSFAVGLKSASGEWLSYIAGWRGLDGTYLDWQLNREEPVNASISTVIRSYLLDQELERHSPAIVFVGGTVPLWSRVCAPVVCGELLVIRPGILGKLSARLARRFSPSGKLTRLQGGLAPFVAEGPDAKFH